MFQHLFQTCYKPKNCLKTEISTPPPHPNIKLCSRLRFLSTLCLLLVSFHSHLKVNGKSLFCIEYHNLKSKLRACVFSWIIKKQPKNTEMCFYISGICKCKMCITYSLLRVYWFVVHGFTVSVLSPVDRGDRCWSRVCI